MRDQTCLLHCYTNTERTKSKWHLNWSRWKALWTGSKGWYFHAGVKTTPPSPPHTHTHTPLLMSLLSLFLMYVRPQSECIPGTVATAAMQSLPVRAPGAPIWVITGGSEAAGLIQHYVLSAALFSGFALAGNSEIISIKTKAEM